MPEKTVVVVHGEKDQAVCGYFAVGRGQVYFVNGVGGPDQRRWYLNFMHWALDMRVPGAVDPGTIVGTGSAGSDNGSRRVVYDTIKLKNGDSLSGVVRNESLTIKTSYVTVRFAREKIERISLEGGQNNLDIIILKVGDQLSGVLQNEKIKIKLVSGGEAEIDKDKIKEVEIRYTEPKETHQGHAGKEKKDTGK